jgi:hypothetical protein
VTGQLGETSFIDQVFEEQRIEVAFACAPGQQFVIHWFPEAIFYNLTDAPAASLPTTPDAWDFPVATRRAARDPWTRQATTPHLDIYKVPIYITLPPLPYITPPLKLTDVVQVVTEPAAPPQYLLEGNGFILDYTKVTSTINVTTAYRADTGEELIVANPEALRSEQTIQVVGCLELDGTIVVDGQPRTVDIDCENLDLVVEIVSPDAGIFQNQDETALSQTTVLFKVELYDTVATNWDATETQCRYWGGQFSDGDPGASVLWFCDFDPDIPHGSFLDIAVDMKQPQFCPTGIIPTDIVSIEGGFMRCLGEVIQP